MEAKPLGFSFTYLEINNITVQCFSLPHWERSDFVYPPYPSQQRPLSTKTLIWSKITHLSQGIDPSMAHTVVNVQRTRLWEQFVTLTCDSCFSHCLPRSILFHTGQLGRWPSPLLQFLELQARIKTFQNGRSEHLTDKYLRVATFSFSKRRKSILHNHHVTNLY